MRPDLGNVVVSGPKVGRMSKLRLLSVLAAVVALTVTGLPAGADDPPGPAESGSPDDKQRILEAREWDKPDGVPEPVDPQSWQLPDWMTWDDYNPIPGWDWNDPVHEAAITFRGALVHGDFADRDFVITQPAASNPFGLPTEEAENVDREDVAQWYEDYLNVPQEVNRGRTINEYWMESSYGRFGISATGYGPYRMAGKEHEYGLNEWGGQAVCPEGDTCNRNFMSEAYNAWVDDVGRAHAESYDFVFFNNPGNDESSVWQEMGEMIFQTRNDVHDAFGPPDPEMENWAPTRYVEWTSWYAAKALWSRADIVNSRSLQSESSAHGTYAHEFSHILGVLDNYNNPYASTVRRSYTGPWANLSRGIFNGPGGPHRRWLIPANEGGHVGSHHMLRNKIRLGMSDPSEIVAVERDALAATGPVVVDVWPRSIPLGPGTGRDGVRGLNIALGTGDHSPSCSPSDDYRCDGGGYQNYTVEVVDRIGYDSFTPDHGTLITKTKNVDLPPFMWVVDAGWDTLELVDFYRPEGTSAMMSPGDYRQLVNSAFKAGLAPGTEFEHVDEENRLHFYVLDVERDDDGVRRYRVAVRHLEAGGPFPRDVTVGEPQVSGVTPGRVAACTVDVTNAGLPRGGPLPAPLSDPALAGDVAAAADQAVQAGLAGWPGLTSRGLVEQRAEEIEALLDMEATDITGLLGRDIIRVEASSDSPDWNTTMAYEVVDLGPGETARVDVFVWRDGSEPSTTVAVTATSETDPDATGTGACHVDVPATTPAGEASR